MQFKTTPRGLLEVKATGTGWEVSGYASTWGDPPDAYNDVVARGAFAQTIRERKTKLLLEHDVPIGRELELKETVEGLWGRWSISDTTAGRDAHQLLADGVLDALSIGYVATDTEQRSDGVRVIRAATLYEVSAVSLPANERALVTNVKQRRTASQQHRAVAQAVLTRRARLARHGLDDPRRDWTRLQQRAAALRLRVARAERRASGIVR